MADQHNLARLAMLLALAAGAAYFVRVNYAQTRDEIFRAIVSLDRDSGDVLWIARGLHGPSARIDGRNSPATPTPVTDGRSVCAYFGAPGVMCADIGGRLLWTRGPLSADGYYGVASSPVLADGAIVIASDRPGAERWAHTFATTPTLSGNNRTPLVAEVNGEEVVVLWGMQYLKAVSIRSGDTLWSIPWSSGGDLVSSLTADERRMYLSDATGTVAIEHARLTLGDATRLWTSKARSNCATPVVANGLLFTISDSGIASGIDVETGEVRWQQRLPGRYFSSPVASASAVYFTNSDGITTVVAADRHFRVVARNDLGEEIMATMAAANGELIIRSVTHLYAVGAPVGGQGRGTPSADRRGRTLHQFIDETSQTR
jgi:outer membrane protein assembly factor BamB